jgi:hypothetical protein
MKNVFKNILRDKLGKFKSVRINLLDGQRRGEVVFRRVFLIMVVYLIVVLVGKLITTKPEQKEVVREVEAVEEVEDKVEWVDGDRVTEKADGTFEVVPAENFMDKAELDKIEQDHQKALKIEMFFRVNRNNAPLADHAETFVQVANKYGLDYRLLPAIATLESGGGKKNFRPYNAWGWGSKGFTSFDEGIEVVGKGLKTGYIDKGADTVEKIAPIYCPPNYKNWIASVNQFMLEIENMGGK